MNKPMLGLVLGGVLGVFDGLTALVSAPETAPMIVSIVLGSLFKGLVLGVIVGWFANKVDSVPAGVAFGFVVGLLFAWGVAAMPSPDGVHYYWEIMVPGSIVGAIVGFATQRYGRRTVKSHASMA